ncbi:hypothetical protein H5410_046898 [Solanum commersonii]|uniref:Uncharacterized protein n=1 Tax=Solanum commersonii TaxID=4109 RepID=A0A9J5XHP0_SOLCO|nr:hypothetical protein H5410_046898 [Solanum commersonii]
MKNKSDDINDDGMVINFTYNENEEVLEDYEAQVGEAIVGDAHVETRPVIHKDMVFVVECYCLDLNLPPPEENDKDSY